MTEIDIDHLRSWIGRTESTTDRVTPVPVAALRATLDQSDITIRPGDLLPPMWHQLYFLPLCRQSELSHNGHPRLGGYMPPVTLPRRMYAGGSMLFHQSLHVGEEIHRISTIDDVNFKPGRSGPLVFLKIKHEISNAGGPAITEEQDIVYRTESRPNDPVPAWQSAPDSQQWEREVTANPIMLFRFSALTFNGHRIHYDFPYVTSEEGYPDLIVHGPLLAILLLDLLHRQQPDAVVREFRFRALKPVFVAAPFYLCGARGDGVQGVKLWVRDNQGSLCLDATATVA